MTDTINNAIPFVPEDTIDPAAGLNIALKDIDALLQVNVLALQNDPPGVPSEGDRYIVGTVPTGAWIGYENYLAEYLDAGWNFYNASYAVNLTDGFMYIKNSIGWSLIDSNIADILGIASGFNISINADTTKIDIASGISYFAGNPTPVVFPGETAITLTYRTSSIITWLGVNSSGTVIQQTTQFTPSQRRTITIIGAAIHSNLSTVNAVNNLPDVAVNPVAQFDDLLDALKEFNKIGNVISANGANLYINKSAGYVFKKGANFQIDPTNPHTVSTGSLTAPANLRYRLQDGTEYVDTNSIDPDYYDLAGVKTVVPSNKWTVPRFTQFTSNLIRIQYGQTLYGSKSEAIAGMRNDPFIVESNIAENGLLRAVLVVQQGATALNNTTTAQFFEIDRFGNMSSAASGTSTTSLQKAYDNSTEPEILTDSTHGSVVLKRGSAADTDIILEIKNAADSTTFSIDGNGKSIISTLKVTALSTYADNTAALAGGLIAGDVYRTSTGQLMIVY